ncbi:MAG: hypothetical protein HKN57_15330 [Xanthomonadales bacterium]|nr:antibiotic biosynthesis monooxygenase [Gammaproteobacteria bacterium]MBT8053605.1 antibiotic biosynthesis monooxygenase [Gammaproteobacteria bacterium]NND58617.1 hypothetical protein [Xanthomonadales bacterium]NNK50993.1 hypothetical protein [Xanthomonadales bacterium]
MQNKFKWVLASILLGLLWLLPAQAQEADSGTIARLAMIEAKDGHSEKLLDAIAEYHHWVAQFEGHHEYQWYEVLTGPNTGMFMARTPNHQWADFDSEPDWSEQAGKMFQEKVAPHIAKTTLQFTSEMKDFSHWPENFEGYTHFSVTDWYVHNGHGAKFRKGLKTIVDTLKAGGYAGYWGFFSVESGAKGNLVRIVGAHRGWADMADKDPSFSTIMGEAMGGEEAVTAFMSDWSATFKPGMSQMIKYLPEASDYGKDAD